MNSFPLFLALRYLRPKGSFISIITLFSVIGVFLGVMVLVVVTSVMSGFEKKIREITLGFEPHVESFHQPIEAIDEQSVGGNWRDVKTKIEELPNVEKVAPLIRDHAFMEFQGEPVASLLRAMRPEDFDQSSDLANMILEGEFELRGESVILGLGVAEKLGVKIGDKIVLYSSDNIRGVVRAVREYNESDTKESENNAIANLERVVLPLELEVRGVFQRSLQFDHEAVVPLYIAQEILGMNDEVTSLGIWTNNADQAVENSDVFKNAVSTDWFFVPWMNKPEVKQWFETIRTERAMMTVVLFFIVLVAAFSIMNTIITVAVQKRREVGVVTALGGRVDQVIWVFLLQGAIVGFIGVVLGMLAGVTFVHFRNEIHEVLYRLFGVQIFPPNIYGVPEIPAEYRLGDLLKIGIGSFVLCTLAALPPALMSAMLDPAKALRNE